VGTESGLASVQSQLKCRILATHHAHLAFESPDLVASLILGILQETHHLFHFAFPPFGNLERLSISARVCWRRYARDDIRGIDKVE
jgi:hypothetical protein